MRFIFELANIKWWNVSASNARVKLKHIYPVFEEAESGVSMTPNWLKQFGRVD
jgi:hypothetical protein